MSKSLYSYPEQLVLDALTSKGTITTYDISNLDIWQPAAIIFSLREKGVCIDKKMKRVSVDGRWRTIAHYTIVGGYYV